MRGGILITGGAGFIGSHFVKLCVEKKEFKPVITLDNLSYAGNLFNLKDVLHVPDHIFVKGDIRNAELVAFLIERYGIEAIVNFAAHTHVDRSIKDANPFVKTNYEGVYVLLEQTRRYRIRFVQISTDEVYGPIIQGYVREDAPLNPSNPYAASKAAADLLVLSYAKTYGIDAVITRSSNNFGPNQYPEKFIPVIIKSLIKRVPIPIYGNGLQIRDWLYVRDNVEGIYKVVLKGRKGEIYNIAGHNELKNIELVKLIIEIFRELTDTKEDLDKLISFVKDRPAHDIRYGIDDSKVRKELDFTNRHNFIDALKDTVKWYIENPSFLFR